jgi:Homeodomain-like domain
VDDAPTALTEAFARWGMDLAAVRTLGYRAPPPRERERWHAVWLLARGWTAADVAGALERERRTSGEWRAGFCRDGPARIAFAHAGGSPPPRTRPSRRS